MPSRIDKDDKQLLQQLKERKRREGKSKKYKHYVLDCGFAVKNKLFDISDLETYLWGHIKVGPSGLAKKNRTRKKFNAKTRKVMISKERLKLTVSATNEFRFSKKQLKFLLFRFLKSNKLQKTVHIYAGIKMGHPKHWYILENSSKQGVN